MLIGSKYVFSKIHFKLSVTKVFLDKKKLFFDIQKIPKVTNLHRGAVTMAMTMTMDRATQSSFLIACND